MRIVWTEPALRDLASARAYIARDNPTASNRQVEYVLTAVSGLLLFPESGRPGRRMGTRELIVGKTPFIVPYRARADVIEILRILHSRRRWPDAI